MNLEEKHEEVLETVWISTKEEGRTAVPRAEIPGDGEVVDELVTGGYLSATDGQVALTPRGEPFARNVIRRHRLAERLLADVLDTTNATLMDEKACKFEHILDLGLDDSICTLLGHPRICPHGKPIPPGRCCRENEVQPSNLVSPLSRLIPGQKGKVAYVHAPEIEQLQKLMAMGVLPGAPVELVQSFPSYVFRVRQSQFAVDADIASAIYVRLTKEDSSAGQETESATPGNPRRHRFGWWNKKRVRG